MQTNISIDINEKPFRMDYTKNLSTAFLALRELQMDLNKETNQELNKEMSRVDLMEQDVLHILEFVDFNAAEGYKFAKMLQTIRRARRKIKDRIEERSGVQNLINLYINSGVKKQLEQLITGAEKRENGVAIRSYRLRELTELEGFQAKIQKQKELLKSKAS